MPFVRGLLDLYATVRYIAPADITPRPWKQPTA